jgi:hypothetical protein
MAKDDKGCVDQHMHGFDTFENVLIVGASKDARYTVYSRINAETSTFDGG